MLEEDHLVPFPSVDNNLGSVDFAAIAENVCEARVGRVQVRDQFPYPFCFRCITWRPCFDENINN